MNGINTPLCDFQKNIIHAATITGYNVQGIFCPTFGIATDLFCCQQALFNGAAFEGTRALQRKIQEFHENSDPGSTMLVIPHSRGAIYTRNALMDSPAHLRKKVDILAIAPGAFINRVLCNDVKHIRSMFDPVPKLNISGLWRCRDAIITLYPDVNSPYLDHEFISPTYVGSIENETKRYMRK